MPAFTLALAVAFAAFGLLLYWSGMKPPAALRFFREEPFLAVFVFWWILGLAFFASGVRV